jgi:diguanylate cyclase (GGDEF)-like protein
MHRYMVESSRDLIFTITPDGRFAYLNPRIESLLGYRCSALIGQHFSEIVYPEDLDRSRQAFSERRTGARASSNVELRLNRSAYGVDTEGDGGPVLMVVDTMGIYSQFEAQSELQFAGTYGVARARPLSHAMLQRPSLAPSYHDPLTQLPNRELFHDRLDLAIAQAKRRKGQIAVMFVDVDRTRLINETLGQGEGDALLRATAQRLKQGLRRGDTLTRSGSDEFAILLPDANGRKDASAIAEKILEAFRQPFPQHRGELVIALSLGIALHPEDGDSAETLTRHAAIAMHQVKRNASGYGFFSPDMHAQYRDRICLEGELRQALARNELELHYQPLVSVSRNCVTGMEALIRWQHPKHGLISPARFIQLAEDAGMIHDISRWVLETGCAQLSAWRRLYPDLRLAANLSLRDFDRADLSDTVNQILARNGLPAESLELEITESLMLGQHEHVRTKVRSLRELGVGLSIDDFGTGYSSLTYLQDFAVTRLKIDRSFVRGINANGSHPIIHAIAGIARGFDIQIAALGVERVDQVNALENMGCDEMQGFYFCRPVNARGATAILRDFRPASVQYKTNEDSVVF